MKKLIYNLFTVENGIVLSTSVISYINEKVSSNEDLVSLLNAFKSRFNSSTITKEEIDIIFNSKTEDKIFYTLKTFKFEHRDLCKEFEYFKNRFQNKTTPISLIEQGIVSTIFGIFYKNGKGKFCIEDDYDVIDLEIDNIHLLAAPLTSKHSGLVSGARGLPSYKLIGIPRLKFPSRIVIFRWLLFLAFS